MVLSSSGGELALQLPLESVSNFPAVLQQLEADVQLTNDNDDMKAGRRVAAVSVKQLDARGAVDSKAGEPVDDELNGVNRDVRGSLNVTGFGLSVTSLEEVFLRLNEDSSDDGDDDAKGVSAGADDDVAIVVGASDTDGARDHQDQGNGDDTHGAAHDHVQDKHTAADHHKPDGQTPVSIWNVEPVARSCTRQWRSMFRKRWIAFKRDVKGIVFQVLLPVVFVALIMLTLTADISPVGAYHAAHTLLFVLWTGWLRTFCD